MRITKRRLVDWVNNQKAAYRRGELSKERIAKLEAIPGWQWNPLLEAWEKGYSYTLKYGLVHSRWVAPDGYCLGRWQHLQRNDCKIPERRKRLEQIPGWAWSRQEAAWWRAYKLALKSGYIADQKFKTKDGFGLGHWFVTQRVKYRNPKSNPERRKLLEKIKGWSWDPREERFQKNYALSLKYGTVTEHFVTKDGLKLGNWQKNLRINCKDPKRLKLLRKIPGWFEKLPVGAKRAKRH